jgi:hypothetical protein
MTSDDQKTWKLPLQDSKDGSGDRILELPDPLLVEMGWQEGDTLSIEPCTNGLLLRKVGSKPVNA